MLAPPDTLLGRLQRGRGDAIRELLAMPRDEACSVLLDCLCTPEEPDVTLATHVAGYVELVLALQPDLARWFAHVRAFEPSSDGEEQHMIFPLGVLACCANNGQEVCVAFLREYLLEGSHWRLALDSCANSERPLDADIWRALIPRLDDNEIARYLGEDPIGDELARTDQRVRRVLDARREWIRAREAAKCWSEANYANALLSQHRFRILSDLLERDPEAAKPLVVDGLWDGNTNYRTRCVRLCDLAWPGVRERLEELSTGADSSIAQMAFARFEERI